MHPVVLVFFGLLVFAIPIAALVFVVWYPIKSYCTPAPTSTTSYANSHASNSKYTRALSESYEQCVRIAQTYQSDIPNSEFKFEICAYLYYVVLIVLIGGKSNGSQEAYRVMEEIKRSGIVPLNKHRELESRITLYNDVMAGRTQPRGDCVFGNTSALEGTGPLGSITIVLGDILVNSQCANNYDGAPFVLHGADTFIQVLSNVTIPVAEAGMSLFNKINVM